MWRWLVLAACGCGRVAFDARGDAAADESLAPRCTGLDNLAHMSTTLDNGRLVLGPGASIGFASGVCDARSTTTWQRLRPVAAAPYDKPFVVQAESGYPTANLDPTGLVAYWAFEGSGGLANSSTVDGHGASVTVINPDNAGLAYNIGRYGTSMHFDGVDAYLRGALPAPLGTEYTLMAWIHLDDLVTESHILGPTNVQFFVEGTMARLESGDANGEFDIHGATVLTTARWYHAAMTHDASGWKLYLDGALDATGTQQIPAGATLLIGEIIGEQMPDYFTMNGRIDEAVVLSRALTAQEILEIYERGAERMLYEMRTCDSLPCATEWAGPFSEETNTSPTPATYDLSLLPAGRYLEWRAVLETDGASPELIDMIVE